MSKDKYSDKDYMQIALKAAAYGRYTTSPNPAVGCVIVRDDKILSVGFHNRAGEPHAEIMALRSAKESVEGATCYVTLEPCSHYGRTPPCAKALCEAKVKRVVVAMADPNPKVSGRGIKMLRDAGIKVKVGVLAEEAYKLNRAFFKAMKTQRPFTIVKYGMSLDSKLALSSGESQWITNAKSRSDVQRLRLWSDAIITSRETVMIDNPRLNVRVSELPMSVKRNLGSRDIKQPVRVIIDSHGELCKDRDPSKLLPYSIFNTGFCYIVHGTHEPFSQDLDGNDGLNLITPTNSGCGCGDPDCHAQISMRKGADPDHIKFDMAQEKSKGKATKSSKKAKGKGKEKLKKGERGSETIAKSAPEYVLGETGVGSLFKNTSEVAPTISAQAAAALKMDLDAVSNAASKSIADHALGNTKSVPQETSGVASIERLTRLSAEVSELSNKPGKSPTKLKVKTHEGGDVSAGSLVLPTRSANLLVTNAKSEKVVAYEKSESKSNDVWTPEFTQAQGDGRSTESNVVLKGANFKVESWLDNVYVVSVPFTKDTDGSEHVDLGAVLDFLGAQEIRVAMVESGPSLASAFMRAGLIDECYCYIAPKILGNGAYNAFNFPQPERLADAITFEKCKVKIFGNDVRLTLTSPAPKAQSQEDYNI